MSWPWAGLFVDLAGQALDVCAFGHVQLALVWTGDGVVVHCAGHGLAVGWAGHGIGCTSDGLAMGLPVYVLGMSLAGHNLAVRWD
jgi:hypothetical protein